MPVTSLDPLVETALRTARFTYDEVGQTAGPPPAGFTAFSRTAMLETRDFETATADLLGWQIQARSGVRVATSSKRIVAGSVALLRVGPPLLTLSAPCRVVYVVDEPARQGFAYGTLPGHPESGEEAFILEVTDDRRLMLTITAFSRPATTLTKAVGRLGRAAQRAMTNRYLRALDRP